MTPRSRLIPILLLIAAALVVAATGLAYLVDPRPVAIDTTLFGGHVRFATDRSHVLDRTGCLDVRWQVEGIRAVFLNEKPQIGAGEGRNCGDPRLRVVFRNGATRDFVIERQVVLTSPVRAALLLAAVAVAVALVALRRRRPLTAALAAFLSPRLDSGARPTFAQRLRADLGVLLHDLRCWLRAETRPNRAALLIIVVLGVGLRLAFINQPIRHDEINTYYNFAARPLLDGLSRYPVPNNHLFNTFLMHITTRLLGTDEWVLRLPVFVTGALTVPAVYAAGRALFNSATGLLAAAVVAGVPILIVFATNARGYSYVVLFTLLLIPLAQYLPRRENIAAWFLLGLLAVLGFYTLPTMAYPFGAIALWLLIGIVRDTSGPLRRRQLTRYVVTITLAAAVTLLLYTPIFLREGVAQVIANDDVKPLPWHEFVSSILPGLTNWWRSWTYDLPPILPTLIIIGLLVGLPVWRARAPRAVLLLLLFPGWLAFMMTMQRVQPFIRGVPLYLLPILILGAASGWAWLLERQPLRLRRPFPWAIVASLILVLWLGTRLVVYRFPLVRMDTGLLRGAEDIVLFLKDRLQPYDTVIVRSRVSTLRYYFQRHHVHIDHLRTDRNDDPRLIRRLFVVVRRDVDAVDDVFEINRVNVADFYPVERIYQGEAADVYVTYRRVFADEFQEVMDSGLFAEPLE